MSGAEPASEQPQRPPLAAVGASAAGYGACTPASRRGSREDPLPASRRNSRDEPCSGDSARSGDSDKERLSFKKFSRSVARAAQLARAVSPLAEPVVAVEPAAANAADAPQAPRAKRTWYDLSNDGSGLLELARESWLLLCALLVSSALAFASIAGHWGATATFSLNFLALMPLAVLLGDLTEALSGWCGPTLGGLLNATLGNATEAIVLVQAVSHRLVGVEQAALLGGVLSNTLLVLGLSFIVGGAQTFDTRVAAADVGVLLVAVVGVILPTIAAGAPGGSLRDTLADSRATACVLLLMYGAFLVYTLSPAEDKKDKQVTNGDAESTPLLTIKSGQELDKVGAENADKEEEEEEQPSMSLCVPMCVVVALLQSLELTRRACRAQLVHPAAADSSDSHHGVPGGCACHERLPSLCGPEDHARPGVVHLPACDWQHSRNGDRCHRGAPRRHRPVAGRGAGLVDADQPVPAARGGALRLGH